MHWTSYCYNPPENAINILPCDTGHPIFGFVPNINKEIYVASFITIFSVIKHIIIFYGLQIITISRFNKSNLRL